MKSHQKRIKSIFICLCGAIIGCLNGFFGGGGGMLCVPLLENICGFKNKQAHATALCIMLPLSMVSSVVYISKNSINFSQLCLITAGAILGAILGSLFLKKINVKFIKVIFVVLMFAAGLKMVL